MRRFGMIVVLLAGLVVPQQAQAAAPLEDAITQRWLRDDGAVARGELQRAWTWGPQVARSGAETYDDAPGGRRSVWYWDKGRMEITDPQAAHDEWFVTSGLLVRELISGQMQTGSRSDERWEPAAVPVAGDLDAAPSTTLTYADLTALASLSNDRRAPALDAALALTATLTAGGVAGYDAALARWDVHPGAYDAALGHTIPDVFVDALSPENLLYLAGHPLTESYWVTVPISHTPTQVLLQAFERRVLTYTPTNAPAWQVEWGNVGSQYAQWRYGDAGDGAPITPSQPAAVALQELRTLSPTAADIAKNRKGAVGVAVYRLDTDQFYSFQGTRSFPMYSTVKVPIMLTVLDRAVREDRRVTTREQTLIELMIQYSDNNAATTLLNSVGGARAVEAFLRRNNINNTYINNAAWGASTTTVQDMARLMARLGNCMMLVQRLCTYALTTMRGVTSAQAWGVSAGVPKGGKVALKNGWYPDRDGWGVNSIGLIQSQGKNYAIAVYTYPDPSMGYGITTIEQIAATIYPAVK